MERRAVERPHWHDVLQALAGVGIFIWCWISTAIVGLVYCGGDGGSPYAAPASPRGHMCSLLGGGGGVVVWLPMALVALSWVPAIKPHLRLWITIVAALYPLAIMMVLGNLDQRCTSGGNTANCVHY